MKNACKRSALLLALALLAGCAAAPHAALPGTSPRTASDAATGLPGDAATGLPGDAATGLPGDAATGLPGDAATGLPGDAATGLPGDAAMGLPGDAATGLPGTTFACAPVLSLATARCPLQINTSFPALPAAIGNAVPGWHPADLQSAYSLPTANGAGTTVAIVDAYDAPLAEQDLAIYRSAFGLPSCTSANGCFRKVNQSGVAGTYPPVNTGWAQEIALDLDMVSAACPKCNILLVEARSALMDDLGAAVDTAVALGAKAVSNSYYASEWPTQSNESPHYYHPGVAIVASSGDAAGAFYPATSNSVTAVGATTLSRTATGWTQTPWSRSGRGCSTYTAKPWFQQFSKLCTTRAAVDLTVVGDPQTGVAMFDSASGGWLVAGGTSVGSPLIAAAKALAGSTHGPGWSYWHYRSFTDLGPTGYDLPTGLGSPNGVAGL